MQASGLRTDNIQNIIRSMKAIKVEVSESEWSKVRGAVSLMKNDLTVVYQLSRTSFLVVTAHASATKRMEHLLDSVFGEEIEITEILPETDDNVRIDFITEESVLIPSPHLQHPGNKLSPDELKTLRETATALNHLSDVISPISDCFEERLAVLVGQQPYKMFSDGSEMKCFVPRIAPEIIEQYQNEAGEIDYNKLASYWRSHLKDLQHICGPIGRSGDNPIDAIVGDLQTLINKIKRLCDTGILQTTSDLTACRSASHLSSDGNTHVKTDIPTDTIGYLESPIKSIDGLED